MGFFNIPENEDIIDAKKKMNTILRQIQKNSKPEKCILCGRTQTSYCNSHSVPAMVLRNIADNGKILQSNSLVGFEILDLEKGVNNSGTFHFICRECDSKYFQDYEDESKLSQRPGDKMLAEIALKNSLLMLSKRTQEHELYRTMQRAYPQRTHFDDMFEIWILRSGEAACPAVAEPPVRTDGATRLLSITPVHRGECHRPHALNGLSLDLLHGC